MGVLYLLLGLERHSQVQKSVRRESVWVNECESDSKNRDTAEDDEEAVEGVSLNRYSVTITGRRIKSSAKLHV